jgi:hypothetical protein
LGRNRLIFSGLSDGNYVSKNRAIVSALRDAARKVSFYHAVEAHIQFVEIDGYSAAVGFGEPRLSYKDSVIASCEDAIFALVQNDVTKIAAKQTTYDTTTVDSLVVRASGVIKGLYILETPIPIPTRYEPWLPHGKQEAVLLRRNDNDAGKKNSGTVFIFYPASRFLPGRLCFFILRPCFDPHGAARKTPLDI